MVFDGSSIVTEKVFNYFIFLAVGVSVTALFTSCRTCSGALEEHQSSVDMTLEEEGCMGVVVVLPRAW